MKTSNGQISVRMLRFSDITFFEALNLTFYELFLNHWNEFQINIKSAFFKTHIQFVESFLCWNLLQTLNAYAQKKLNIFKYFAKI